MVESSVKSAIEFEYKRRFESEMRNDITISSSISVLETNLNLNLNLSRGSTNVKSNVMMMAHKIVYSVFPERCQLHYVRRHFSDIY